MAVLSYALWQSRFGSDRGVLGRMLRVSAENYRVVGVMPRGFDYPDKSESVVPAGPRRGVA